MAANAEINVTQVIKNLSRYADNVLKEVADGCEAVQQKVITDAKGIVPVVTGNLQGSIMQNGILIEDDNVTAFVIANAPYASYVEGVPDEQGRMGRGRKTPFLGPAIYANIDTFRKAIAAAVKRAGI